MADHILADKFGPEVDASASTWDGCFESGLRDCDEARRHNQL